ncbi:MAG: hypothetical protein AAGC64_10130 [Bacteroidota bacterium]
MNNPFLFTLLLLVSSLSGFAQESILKEFSEPRRPTTWLNPICLYPSTLRMINISGDPNYNELVSDIEKILIYRLDSATVASDDYDSWIETYEDVGFEEYINLYGKQTMKILGKEEEYVGLLKVEEKLLTFYLRGDIAFHKIPKLIQSFRKGDLLNVLTERLR